MVWFEVVLVNVYVFTGPADLPSTVAEATWYPVFGVMVKVSLATELSDTDAELTVTVPDGLIEPLDPADAVMV